jgi:hypothetical protein
MVTIDFALDTVMQLSAEDQEYLFDIMKKRNAEMWRQSASEYYIQLKEEIRNGSLKPVTVEEAIADLHNYAKSAD